MTFQRQRQDFVVDTTGGFVASLVYELIHGEPGSFGLNHTIAFLDCDGCFELGVVFHAYYPEYGQIELSMASTKPNSLTAQRLAAIIDTASSLGVRMIVSRCHPDNKRAIKILMACGGVRYCLRDLRGEGQDEVFVTMKMADLQNTKYWRKAHGR